ncbi:MAG: WXG100 family type VII secretion target [Lachnospiraceae bacterium]|nr:WXG100 family type VII secretion target [Lachnospiraceae bacterium]
MAGAKEWKVETEKLTSSASKLSDLIKQFDTEYNHLYTDVEELSSKAWTGVASESFNKKIQQYKETLTKMDKVLQQYVEFLNKSAKSYVTTENNVKDATGNL